MVTYPDGCDTPEVRAALAEWIAYRREIGKPYRTPARQLSLLLDRYGTSIVDAVRHSIAQGYQGCFLPQKGGAYGRGRLDDQSSYRHDPGRPVEAI